MFHEKESLETSATEFISIRVSAEQKDLVSQAAEREGLYISHFIILLLVRLHILPASSIRKTRRRPVPRYHALQGLIGTVNRIGGNCKQLAASLPDTEGLALTHASIIRAAEVISDAMNGNAVPEGVNLYRLQGDITREGYVFNQIVKSVNSGNPSLAQLPATLTAIKNAANTIIASLTGQLVQAAPLPNITVSSDDEIMEKAMEEMRRNMRKKDET